MFVPAFVVSQFFVHTAVAELSPAAVSRGFIERYVGCSWAVLMLVLTIVRTLRYLSISVISATCSSALCTAQHVESHGFVRVVNDEVLGVLMNPIIVRQGKLLLSGHQETLLDMTFVGQQH